jgi:Tol biopolymer transport system component
MPVSVLLRPGNRIVKGIKLEMTKNFFIAIFGLVAFGFSTTGGEAQAQQLKSEVFGQIVSEVGNSSFASAIAFDSDPTEDREQPSNLRMGKIRSSEDGFRAIYSLKRDGSEATYVAAIPGMIATTDPAVSPDGQYLAVCGLAQFDDVRNSQIFVTAMSGPFQGAYRPLAYGNTPWWSPDGTRIAYMVNPGAPGDSQPGIWTMDANGGDKKWIGEGWYPRWSPDGRRMIAHDWEATALKLIDLEHELEINLFPSQQWSLAFYGGHWSPDSKQVAFIGRFKGKEHLAIIDVDEGEESIKILYTSESSHDQLLGPPAWSPDGDQILFIIQNEDQSRVSHSRQWTNSYLYSIAAKVPSGPRLLESKKVGLINRFATWHPDGTKVYFSSERPFSTNSDAK